jgi:cell fate regulator YaaT (PSP1 superfamily)
MGCGSGGCGTSKDGAPGGCQSHGSCSTGGCNRMNVHDWLANLPFSDPESGCRIIEVSFNNGSRKDFYRNITLHHYEKGEMIAVEGVSGFDVGMVNMTGELVRLQMKKRKVDEKSPDIRKVLRRATEADISKMVESKAREAQVLIRSRAMARQLKLDLKMAEVEVQADSRKATFFYIADDRVDFRELIKLYASEFKVKVEMRQIGARQEAGKVGGIGSCGRELCCSTWLTDFKSVNTNAARYQNLSINQTKLSGQCGRLKCCLNYELDTYMDALQFFPDDADMLEMEKSRAFLVKKDIFRNLMWYTMPDSNKQYPLTIERVKKIKELNKQGVRPADLEPVEVVSNKPKEIEPTYADVVGQISLKALEKTSRKRRDQEKGGNQQGRNRSEGSRGQGGGGNQQSGGQGQNRSQNPGGNQQNRGGGNQQQGGNQGNRSQQGGKQSAGSGGQKRSGGQNAGGNQRNNPNRQQGGGNQSAGSGGQGQNRSQNSGGNRQNRGGGQQRENQNPGNTGGEKNN